MPYKVIHERSGCIQCGKCWEVCPKHWEKGEDDYSNFKGVTDEETDYGEKVFETKEALGCNQEAANICPVSVIKVKQVKQEE